MTPITEDQVLSLMKGVEDREKRALKKLSEKHADAKSGAARMTARIFSFSRSGTPEIADPHASSLVDLNGVRAARAAKRATTFGPGPEIA